MTLHPDKLTEPLSWRTPRRVFVNSMSDLFHDQVPDEFIAGVFAVMALAHRHTFQVLTKRPGRMASLLARPRFLAEVAGQATTLLASSPRVDRRLSTHGWTPTADPGSATPLWAPPWPLRNVWLDTSVEDQRWAAVRLAKLAQTLLWSGSPAASTRYRHMTAEMQARVVAVIGDRLAVALAAMPQVCPKAGIVEETAG